jgi:hypothetical protein
MSINLKDCIIRMEKVSIDLKKLIYSTKVNRNMRSYFDIYINSRYRFGNINYQNIFVPFN